MVTDGESLCCGLWAERNDLTGKFMQKALTVVDAAEITGKGTVIIGIDSMPNAHGQASVPAK